MTDETHYILVVPDEGAPCLIGPFYNRDGAEGYAETYGSDTMIVSLAPLDDWIKRPLRIEAP